MCGSPSSFYHVYEPKQLPFKKVHSVQKENGSTMGSFPKHVFCKIFSRTRRKRMKAGGIGEDECIRFGAQSRKKHSSGSKFPLLQKKERPEYGKGYAESYCRSHRVNLSLKSE